MMNKIPVGNQMCSDRPTVDLFVFDESIYMNAGGINYIEISSMFDFLVGHGYTNS